MGILLKTVGNTSTTLPGMKRAVAELSDGSVAMLVVDMNVAGLSGGGGDATGVPKFHLYHSTDRTTWTLKSTVNAPVASGGSLYGSMVADGANNIHFAWRWGSTIRYTRFNWAAGNVWTPAADAVVASGLPSGYNSISLIDIDSLGDSTAALVIAAHYYNTTAGAKKTAVGTYVRTTAGAWVAHSLDQVLSGSIHLGYSDDITVAGDTKTAIAGDNIAIFSYNVTRKQDTGGDAGDLLTLVRVNVSTGARVGTSFVRVGHYAGAGGGFRKFWLYNSAANEFTLAGIVNTTPFQCGVYRFSWNRSTNVATQIIAPVTGAGQGIDIGRGSQNHSWCTTMYSGSSDQLFFYGLTDYVLVAAASIVGSTTKSVNFRPGWQRWDNGNGERKGSIDMGGTGRGLVTPTDATVSQVFGGATRNQTGARLDVMAYHYNSSTSPGNYKMVARGILPALAPANVLPAASATIMSDRPTLSADFRLQMYYAQLPEKMVWQLATDAGFATNLRTVTEADTDFVLPNGTSSGYLQKVTNTEALTAINQLFQGTWYIRAQSKDYAGNVGAWSAGQSFVITHKPIAANMYPTGGAVLLWGNGGNVTFSWKFTDPSPSDTQTAYQIVVATDGDFTTVVDTGKVVSTAKTATIALPPSAKDVNLVWKIQLWDSGDVAGGYTAWSLFYVADAPAPTISSPASGAVLSSGIPTIQWSPGLGGTRTQTSYRVMISSSSFVAYNSGWINSAATAHTVPVGYLKNNQQYTISVEVKDNLSLGGQATVPVSTSWTPPLAPAPTWEVYVHDYARRGYVYITWTNDNQDPDFAAWNIYRRRVGDGVWSLIASYTSGTDRYAHRDYMAASGQTYEYAITQMVARFGDLMESTITRTVAVRPDADNYWIIDTLQPDKSIPLYSVNSDNFREEYEQETYSVIGRGRHVDYGDRLGYSGSLSAQVRDKATTALAAVNYLFNPAMSYFSVSGEMPDRWSRVTSGTVNEVTYGSVEFRNPSPTGKTPFRLQSSALGTTSADTIRVEQTLNGADFPKVFTVPGTQAVFSTWIGFHTDNANKAYRLVIEWLDAGGGVISSSSTSAITNLGAAAVETFIPPSSVDVATNASEQWVRIQVVSAVPSTVPSGVRVKISLEGSGGASSKAQLIVGGSQLEMSSRTPYIDGNQFGSSWVGIPYLSASQTTGYYTARQQRLALEDVKSRKGNVYLRNPFGDIWLVAPGDIGVNRVPGVGRSEFVDVDISYQEVGF